MAKTRVVLDEYDDGWSVTYWGRKDGENYEFRQHAPNARAVATILTGIRPEPLLPGQGLEFQLGPDAWRSFVATFEPVTETEPPHSGFEADVESPPNPLLDPIIERATADTSGHAVTHDDTRGEL